MENSNRIVVGRVLKVAIVLIAAVMLILALKKFFGDEKAVADFGQVARARWQWLLLIVALLPINWMLETAKWKKLVAVSEKISWSQAWSGVLAGLAIGSATPNRIGEFAGRIFQLKATPLQDGIVYTLISSFMQVAVTVVCGAAGLLLSDTSAYMHSAKAFAWTGAVAVVAIIVVGIAYTARGKIAPYFSALRKTEGSVLLAVAVYSLLRYLVYSLQFFLMLRICGVTASLPELWGAIAVNYLVVTIIPSVMITEIFVRGTVASGVIGSLCGNPEGAALAAVILWMINVGVPGTIGLFFVRNISFFGRKK